MIKLGLEGMWKAKIGWNLGPLCQKISQDVKAKEKFLKEIKISAPMNTPMIRKWNSLNPEMEKVVVVWLFEDANQLRIVFSQCLIQIKVLSLQFYESWEVK